MFADFLSQLVQWIMKFYNIMDGIVLIEAGELTETDITLFDVYVDFAVVVAIVHVLFSFGGGPEWETYPANEFDWDDD